MEKETTEDFSLTIVRTGSINSNIGLLNRDGISQMVFVAEQLSSKEDAETIILTGPSFIERQSGMIIQNKINRNRCRLENCVRELKYNESKLVDYALEKDILNLVKKHQNKCTTLVLVVGEHIACLFSDYFAQYIFGFGINRVAGPKEGCAINFKGGIFYIEPPMIPQE